MAREIARWDPFKELATLRDEVDRLFDTFFGRLPTIEIDKRWVPAINLEETEDEYIVSAELPGMNKDDIKVKVTEDGITISGERKMEKEEKGKTYHRIEMTYGSFKRTISFPDEVVPDKAKATYKDGILRVTVPKSQKSKPKEVEIKLE